MKANGLKIISLLTLILAFIVGVWAYPQMPEKVATHWNIAGEADGYMDRFWGVFLLPVVMTAAFLLLNLVPQIDPRKKNIAKFRSFFDGFILVFLLFFLILYKLTLLWNLGYQVPFNVVLPILMGGLIFYLGILVEHAEPNWSIGIRTPWTLSSDTVWEKTHALGGKLYKIAGILSILASLVSAISFYIVIFSIMGVSIFLLGYSYYLYRGESK